MVCGAKRVRLGWQTAEELKQQLKKLEGKNSRELKAWQVLLHPRAHSLAHTCVSLRVHACAFVCLCVLMCMCVCQVQIDEAAAELASVTKQVTPSSASRFALTR